ncbi:dihydrolipoyllysine-residue succinyltransferase [Ranunculus cassubicifolius]
MDTICREFVSPSPKGLPSKVWTRSFSADSDDTVEAVVPFMGESISDGNLANFLKKVGDSVTAGEAIAQIETDKVTIDVPSPESGVIQKVLQRIKCNVL